MFLDMQCFVGDLIDVVFNNVVMSYGYNDEWGIYVILCNSIDGCEFVFVVVGGIVCNVNDMFKWL